MAIKGEILMSPDLEEMQMQILNNQRLKIWEIYSYPSLKPLASWLEEFI
jgi:dynein heavy chain